MGRETGKILGERGAWYPRRSRRAFFHLPFSFVHSCSLSYIFIFIIYQELETGHNVVKTRGPHDSRFTFTSHTSGDHAICLSTGSGTSWATTTHIRLYLDIVVGSTKSDREHDRSHVTEMSQKLRDLNNKLEDIRREQQYQRERESNFRDLSEATNSRAVWYSVVQIGVLVATCVWQLRHLKVCFHNCVR